MSKPTVRDNYVGSVAVMKACQEYVDYIDGDDFHPDEMDDYEYDIFEKSFFSVFGKDIFKWMNEKID